MGVARSNKVRPLPDREMYNCIRSLRCTAKNLSRVQVTTCILPSIYPPKITRRPSDAPLWPRKYSAYRGGSNWSSSSSWLLFSFKRFKGFLSVLGMSVAAGIGLYSILDTEPPLADCHQESHDDHVIQTTNGKKLSGRYNFIAEAVEKAVPSVVYIETSSRISTHFGHMAATSSGSGFVVENGQYVLTNAHVVSNATSVTIKLNTGQVVQGEVTDMDEVADLAIIKMDLPKGISTSPLKFGDSNSLRPGEWVVAMGSPLSLTNTITCGIVSSLHRASSDLGLGDRDMEYVQTDAAITIGNSGGPLVNLDGEVIGVNTMTAAPGISFAIPSSIAQNFVRSANKKATGRYKEPESGKKYMIGVSMLALDAYIMPMIQHHFSIPKEVEGGVLLAKVWPHSPAHVAGLREGDVVVRINGNQISSTNDMYKMVRSGKKLIIEYYRNQQFKTCKVIPEAMN